MRQVHQRMCKMKATTNYFSIIVTSAFFLIYQNLALFASIPEQLKFNNLTRKHGVSGSEIRNVIQDDHGRIWFGTRYNGVNVYNGYDIKVFSHNPNDVNSLAGDPAFAVYKDRKGEIWVSTLGAGLCKFNPQDESFTTYRHIPGDSTSIWDNSVQLTFEDSFGNFWVAAANGLDRMDRETGVFTHFSFDPEEEVAPGNQNIKVFYQARDGSLWLGLRRGGLRRIDPETGQILESYMHDPNDTNSISDNNVFAILEDHEGTFWVGTWQGLNILDRSTGTFSHIYADASDECALSDRRIFALYQDSRKSLWVGTGVGLNKYNYKTGEFSRYLNDPNDPHSLVHNEVLHLYEDNSGILWISTLAGMSMLDLSPPKFTSYQATSAANSINSNDVEALLQDSKGKIWFAAEETLNRLDPQSEEIKQFTPGRKPWGPLGYIDDIFEHSDGMFWLGTQNGLFLFDPEKESFNRFREHPNFPLGEEIRQIEIDSSGFLWLNVQGVGLKKLNPLTGEVIRHYYHDPEDASSISDDYINHMVLTDANILWIGSEGGLDRLDITSGILKRYSFHPAGKQGRNPSNDVQHIYIGQDETLWISTISGLNQLNPASGKYTTLTAEHGLPGNLVKWTSEDSLGNLWIGTANGLVCYDNTQTQKFRLYDEADGLSGVELSNDMLICNCGEIYFVSKNKGVNVFLPDRIVDNVYIPPVILTDFQLYNRSIEKYGEDSVLPGPINDVDKLRLSQDQSVFTIHFAALNYKTPEKNLYQYKLEGFDPDWSPESVKRSATYTNLDAGEYTFRVRASNNDGVWNTEGKSIKIIILPPWWESLWFRATMAVILLFLIYSAYRLRVESVHRRNRLLEDLVKERTSELEKSEARFRGLSESTYEGIVMHDQGKIIDANQAILNILDYSRSEFVGGEVKNFVSPKSWNLVVENIRLQYEEPYEAEGIKKDGTTVPIEIHAKNVPYQYNKQIRVAAIRDITQRKDTEKTLREAKEKAEAASRAKSVFLANMSHDLRTPLNGILGYTQILEHDTSISSKQKRVLSIIQKSGEYLLMLINDILDLARADAHKIELDPQPFDLAALISDVCELMQSRAKAKNLNCLTQIGELPSAVLGDERRLRQVLVNLLGNAIKFTEKGSVKLTVQKAEAEIDRIRFAVSDTGIGIAPKDIEHIFDAFEQVREIGQQDKGSGLGLAISDELVKMMQGNLQVESEVGKGSTFWFDIYLPQVDDKVNDASSQKGQIIGIKDRSPKILIVETNPDDYNLLADLLDSKGFEINEVHNGKAALKQLNKFKPDAVILNSSLSDINVGDMIESIRENTQEKEIAILVSTSGLTEEEEGPFLAVGANTVISKPPNLFILFNTLKKLLGLEWIYGQTEPELDFEEPLILPPGAILSKLIDFARIGDINTIQKMVKHLEKGNSELKEFSEKVLFYTDRFQMKQLHKYLESIQKES